MSDVPRNEPAPDPSLRRQDRPEGGQGEALRRTADDLREAAGAVREEAGAAAVRAGETAKGVAHEAVDEGRDIARVVMEEAEGVAEAQKRAGAAQAEGVAHAIRRAADELEGNMPMLAGYVREGAEYVQQTAEALRRRNLRDIVSGVEDFARAQPVAFFGASVLAGLALARFATSSARPEGGAAGRKQGHRESHGGPPHAVASEADMGGAPSHAAASGPGTTAAGAPGWVPRSGGEPAGTTAASHAREGPHQPSRPATMAAATLGGQAAQASRRGDGGAGREPGGGVSGGATIYGSPLTGQELETGKLPHRSEAAGVEQGRAPGSAAGQP